MKLIQNNNLTREQVEYLRKQKIMVATPMYGGMCLGPYATSMCELHRLAGQVGFGLNYQVRINESLVQRGRNAIAHMFMQSDCTHLVFIDGDILFNPLWVLDLVLMELDIVGGFYPKKSINWETVEAALTKYNVDPKKLAHCGADIVTIMHPDTKGQISTFEPCKVTYLGTGFMSITRKAFLDFQKAYPTRHYVNNHVGEYKMYSTDPKDHVWAYFDCEINERDIYLSEDYYFCDKMIKAGYDIWGCPWMNCGHVGTYVFEGCMWCSKGAIIHDICRKEAAESGLARAAKRAK